MAGTPTPEEVVRASVAAYNRHDLEATSGFLAPDAVWLMVGPDLPLGQEAVRMAFWQLFVHDAHLEILSLCTTGNVVAAEFLQTYEDEEGRRMAYQFACFYEIADGKFTRVRQYYHPSWDRVVGTAAG